jgi:hypothetical protein
MRALNRPLLHLGMVLQFEEVVELETTSITFQSSLTFLSLHVVPIYKCLWHLL